VAIWANDAWEQAKKAGMVIDAMLEETPAHWVGSDEQGTSKSVEKIKENQVG